MDLSESSNHLLFLSLQRHHIKQWGTIILHLLQNGIPNRSCLKRSTKWHPQVFHKQTSYSATKNISQSSQIIHLPDRDNLTLTHINLQPVKAWKHTTILIDRSCSLEASQNNIVSSANNKWEMRTPIEFTSPTWKPQSSIFLRVLLKTSIIKRKRRGDKGSPCLKPVSFQKNLQGIHSLGLKTR